VVTLSRECFAGTWDFLAHHCLVASVGWEIRPNLGFAVSLDEFFACPGWFSCSPFFLIPSFESGHRPEDGLWVLFIRAYM